MEFQERVPLAPLTTLGVGGEARYLAEARSEDDACAVVRWARERGLPLFVLGGGSNVLIADRGWPGLALRVAIRGVEERSEGKRRLFTAGAGEEWDALVARAVERDCAGIECLSGIPGTVGGTPIQNVGAYGQEIAETIAAVRVLDLESGELCELSNEECGFHYRSSRFNGRERGRYLVLGVSFALHPGGKPKIAYPDLKSAFAGRSAAPGLIEVREAVRKVRRAKAMLLEPGDPDEHSAGSFFKNPIVDAAQLAAIERAAEHHGLEAPRFPAEGRTKVPAGWLIEHAGFHRGYVRGPVGISSRHALAIVNRGGATAADIVALKDEIQQRVREEFGVELQPEPVFVGF